MQTSRTTIRFIATLLFFLGSQEKVVSQEANSFEQGRLILLSGVNVTAYNSSFSAFEGMIQCSPVSAGSGLGFAAAVGYEMPLSSGISLNTTLGFNNRSGDFKTLETFNAFDSRALQLQPVQTEMNLTTRFSTIDIVPTLNVNLFGSSSTTRIAFAFGPRVGITAGSPTFEQFESIVSPSTAVFVSPSKSQSRKLSDGTVKSAKSLQIGAVLGLSVSSRLSDQINARLQALYDKGIGNLITDGTWTYDAIRIQCGIDLALATKKQIPFTAPTPLPEVKKAPEKPVVSLSLPKPQFQMTLGRAQGRLRSGSELRSSTPFVNAIFFAKDESVVPEKYKMVDADATLLLDEIAEHEYLLPKLAKVLLKNQNFSVVLEAATSPDETIQKSELAKSRAQSVREALVRLGVRSELISTTVLTTPRLPSNNEYPEGREENRRVDVIVQNAPLQEYIASKKYASIEGSIPARIAAQNLVSGERIRLTSNCQSSEVVVNPIENDTLSIPFKCRVSPDASSYSLTVIGESDRSNVKVLEAKSVDFSTMESGEDDNSIDLSSFEALLRFDYKSSSLTEANKTLLTQLVKFIPKNTTIYIFGSADNLGSDSQNEELSKKRASVTQEFLKSISGANFNFVVSSKGKKFNDSTPESRFLNRSIRLRLSQE